MILGFIPALPDSYLIIDLSPFSFDIWLVCNDFPVITPLLSIDALSKCNDFPVIVPSVLIDALSSCNDFPVIVPSASIDAFIVIAFNILPFAIGTFADLIYKCSFSPNVKSSNELINTLPSNVVPFVIIFVSLDFKLNSISIIEIHNW